MNLSILLQTPTCPDNLGMDILLIFMALVFSFFPISFVILFYLSVRASDKYDKDDRDSDDS